jgi:hypothetical protein
MQIAIAAGRHNGKFTYLKEEAKIRVLRITLHVDEAQNMEIKEYYGDSSM